MAYNNYIPKGEWRRIIPKGWGHLDYWRSREYKDVGEKLELLDKAGVQVIPTRPDLFRALSLCRYGLVNVVILAQDPYPNPEYATGVAFSSSKRVQSSEFAGSVQESGGKGRRIPASLRVFGRELEADLELRIPDSGCLEGWCSRGVLLCNVTPTIEVEFKDGRWQAYTHKYWPEWPPLTREIVERLSAKGRVVFALVGRRAHAYDKYIDTSYNSVLYFPHPSPLGHIGNRAKFVGSRFFSSINDRLGEWGKEPINWRLEQC